MKYYQVYGEVEKNTLGGYIKERINNTIKAENVADAIVKFNSYYNNKMHNGYQYGHSEVRKVFELVKVWDGTNNH